MSSLHGWAAVHLCFGSLCLLVFPFFSMQKAQVATHKHRAWTFPRCDGASRQELKGGSLPGRSCCPGKTSDEVRLTEGSTPAFF